jgi:periplasmic protein TonB
VTAIDTSPGAHSVGWFTSLFVHVTLVFGAFVFTQRIQLASQPIPFKWNVAMVTTPSGMAHPGASSVPATATPAYTAPPPRPVARASSASPGRLISKMPDPLEPIDTSSISPVPLMTEGTSVRKPSPPVKPRRQERAIGPIAEERHDEFEPTVAQTPAQSGTTEPDRSTPAQIAAMAPAQSYGRARPDYGWLSETILRRMEELKRYPAEARLDRAEGKVVLKAMIRNNGSIEDVEVYQSSGHQSLDHAAVELLKQASPFPLPRPLEPSHMTVKIPVNYRLEH